jgi:hypothetical protein
MLIDASSRRPVKWMVAVTRSPLPMRVWILSMAKVPWLASIMLPSIWKTAPWPLCSPENRLAPGWCQTMSASRSSPRAAMSPVWTAWK